MMTNNDIIGIFYRKIFHLMKLNRFEILNQYKLQDIHSNVYGERILYTNKKYYLTITWFYGCEMIIDIFNSNNKEINQFDITYSISGDTFTFNEYIASNISDEDAIFINKIRNIWLDVQRL